MSKLFKMCMFFTSFLPLWVSIIFLDVISIIDGEGNKITEYLGIALIIVATIFSLAYLKYCFSIAYKPDTTLIKYPSVRIIKAKREKAITTEYLLSYILPLFVFDFTVWKQVILFFIFFLVLAFLSLKNSNVYANIILEVSKYSYFTCDVAVYNQTLEDITIISKQQLTSKIQHEIEIVRLSEKIYIGFI